MQSTTLFRFAEEYSTTFQNTDAYYLPGMSTTFAFTYSLKGDTPTMINSLPLDFSEAIEFQIAAGAYIEGTAFSGSATFSWSSFDQIPADWSVILSDQYTGKQVNLREESKYEFTMETPTGLSAIETFRDFQQDNSPVMQPMFTGERFTLTITPTSTSTPIDNELPKKVALEQNYPNPFNPTTQINYDLPESADVRLEVFNIQGQRVATLVNGTQNAGRHSVNFDATHLASGVYLYRLQAGGAVLTRKMTLIK